MKAVSKIEFLHVSMLVRACGRAKAPLHLVVISNLHLNIHHWSEDPVSNDSIFGASPFPKPEGLRKAFRCSCVFSFSRIHLCINVRTKQILKY